MNLQEILDGIGEKKFAKMTTRQVHHFYGEKMTSWRNSQKNRISNQNQIRVDQKLNPSIAEEIRRLHWEEDLSLSKLSVKFSVSPSTIKKVLKNQRFHNPNTTYVGIKFREPGRPKGVKMGPSKRRRIISVYDENMNFIEECDGVSLSESLGYGPRWITGFLNTTKNNYHKGSKKYFFESK